MLTNVASKLHTKTKKIKMLQSQISEMYKHLENSYKIDRIVKLENRLAECQNINYGLEQTVEDLDKVKNEQEVSLSKVNSLINFIEIHSRNQKN